MAEPTEMPFGLWTWIGPKNHALDRGPDPQCKGGNFDRNWACHFKV